MRSSPLRPSIVSAPVVPTITSLPFVPRTGPLPSATIVAGSPWHVGASSAETGATANASATVDMPKRAMSFLKRNPSADWIAVVGENLALSWKRNHKDLRPLPSLERSDSHVRPGAYREQR